MGFHERTDTIFTDLNRRVLARADDCIPEAGFSSLQLSSNCCKDKISNLECHGNLIKNLCFLCAVFWAKITLNLPENAVLCTFVESKFYIYRDHEG